MSRYRRSKTSGASYFFTVVTFRRQPILCDEAIRNGLREAIASVRLKRPFVIDAWVLLPDHLHCIWTLPEGDADYSLRWSMIQRKVSIACQATHRIDGLITDSKRKHRESTIWQRRFWEHVIRDEDDFGRHLDYIHYKSGEAWLLTVRRLLSGLIPLFTDMWSGMFIPGIGAGLMMAG